MLDSELFRQQLDDVRKKIDDSAKALDIEKLREELVECQEDMASAGFWDDMERATRVTAQAHRIEKKLGQYNGLVSRADDV